MKNTIIYLSFAMALSHSVAGFAADKKSADPVLARLENLQQHIEQEIAGINSRNEESKNHNAKVTADAVRLAGVIEALSRDPRNTPGMGFAAVSHKKNEANETAKALEAKGEIRSLGQLREYFENVVKNKKENQTVRDLAANTIKLIDDVNEQASLIASTNPKEKAKAKQLVDRKNNVGLPGIEKGKVVAPTLKGTEDVGDDQKLLDATKAVKAAYLSCPTDAEIAKRQEELEELNRKLNRDRFVIHSTIYNKDQALDNITHPITMKKIGKELAAEKARRQMLILLKDGFSVNVDKNFKFKILQRDVFASPLSLPKDEKHMAERVYESLVNDAISSEISARKSGKTLSEGDWSNIAAVIPSAFLPYALKQDAIQITPKADSRSFNASELGKLAATIVSNEADVKEMNAELERLNKGAPKREREEEKSVLAKIKETEDFLKHANACMASKSDANAKVHKAFLTGITPEALHGAVPSLEQARKSGEAAKVVRQPK